MSELRFYGARQKRVQHLKEKLYQTYRDIFDEIRTDPSGSKDDCEVVILRVGHYWGGYDFPKKIHQIAYDYLSRLFMAAAKEEEISPKDLFSLEEVEHIRIRLRHKDYLQSDEWKAVRERALERAGYHCVLCSSRANLQVHHNTYENFGAEKDTDVTVLCDNCHKRFHAEKPFWI